MNPLWLWLIVPASGWLGALVLALVMANDETDLDMERFQGTLKIFAEHLRSQGEETAAQAVETVLKFVRKNTA